MEKIFIIVVILVLTVVCCMTVVYWNFLQLTVNQIPEPYKSKAIDWMNGTPQPVESVDTYGADTEYPGQGNWGSLQKVNVYEGEIPEGLICEAPVTRGGAITDCYKTHSGTTRPGDQGHSVIDYGCSEGSAVITPVSGQVTFAGPNGPYGNLVVVQTSEHKQVYLAHMMDDRLTVEVGQTVGAGDTVGACGSTGNSTGPHVHFEVRNCDASTNECWVVDPFGLFDGHCDLYNLVSNQQGCGL